MCDSVIPICVAHDLVLMLDFIYAYACCVQEHDLLLTYPHIFS